MACNVSVTFYSSNGIRLEKVTVAVAKPTLCFTRNVFGRSSGSGSLFSDEQNDLGQCLKLS